MALQQTLHDIVDAFVFGGFAEVAEELPADHLCPQMGELDPHRNQHFHATASGVGSNRDGAAVEQAAEIVIQHGEPGNGVAEYRWD